MKAQVISFRCVLRNNLGQFISSSFNSEVINQLGQDQGVLTGLAAGLQDVNEGEKRRIVVSADQAYGFYDPALAMKVHRSELKRGKRLKVGSEIRLAPDNAESGSEENSLERTYRVVSFSGDYVDLDSNHPLAGQDLVFEVEVTDARAATPEDFKDPTQRKTERLLH